MAVAWLDLANAFSSVPHSSIIRALTGHGVPSKATSIIKAMYDNARTRIRTLTGLTDPITMKAGVKQGCPLSPAIFNLTLEVVLRVLERSGEGFVVGENRIPSLAYADDIVIMAETAVGLTNQLQAAELAAKMIGISFNPAKCATLHIEDGNVIPTVFSIQHESVKALGPNDYYKHLGIPTGYQVKQTPISSIKELIADTRRLDGSLLAPWQKLDAMRTFILPRLDFVMQGSNIYKSHRS